jgi:hypothetical protein
MPLSESEVKAILEAEKADALSAMQASKLSDDRSKAMDYYLGDMTTDMPAPPDRSKAVSSDVADTVEGLMPSLMEIFAGGDEVVEFEPVGIEDEDGAQQETDYVNHVFMQKNPGFLVLYSFIKDALLQKNGIVKVWWEEGEREERETYSGIPEDAYAQLMADEAVEIEEETLYEVPAGHDETGAPILEPRYDVTVVTRKEYGCARVEGVPPEEFGIARRAKLGKISESGYCYHETPVSEAELIAQGYDEDQIKTLPSYNDNSTEEEMKRNTVDENEVTGNDLNKANRKIKKTEHYCLLDYEGNGKACLYKVVTGTDASTVLRKNGKPDIEKVDHAPFAAMTPVIITHRFFGRSVADLVMDIQRIKTALQRGLLDNIYLLNNQRMELAESHASKNSIDDLLNNRPGGIVRTKQPGGLVPIPNQPIGQHIMPAIEYYDATREWRTGVTRQGQGLDPTALQNVGENAILDAANAARAKTKLIARIFAETGIRDMFSLLHAVIRKNDRQENTVKLRGKWVTVNPRDWKTRNDMTINVGLGSGSKEQEAAFLLQLLGIQEKALMVPQTGLVEPGNIYNTLKRLIRLGGLKSIEPYFMDPDEVDPQTGQPKPKPPPAPSPEEIKAKAQLEIEQLKAQVSMQSEQQKAQLTAAIESKKMEQQAQIEAVQAQADMAVKNREVEAQIALKEREFQFTSALQTQKFEQEMILKREEMQLKKDQAAIDNAFRRQEMKDRAKADRGKAAAK